jgi:hypothetical protein
LYFHEVDIIFNGKIPYDQSFDHDDRQKFTYEGGFAYKM